MSYGLPEHGKDCYMTTELGKVEAVQQDDSPARLYTIPQAARQLGISPRKTWDKVWSEEIETVWLDGRRLVTAQELDRFVASLPKRKPVVGVRA